MKHDEGERDSGGMDRRRFLKSAAASVGASAAAAATAAGAADGAQAAAGEAARGGKEKAARLPGDIVIERPGSDFMVDVLKTLDLEFITTNPASSFRSLHESIVNYGGNRKPELLTCTHEEIAVAIAHGYGKAAGKPMAAVLHGAVGLMHASMALYNAWVDRVPIMAFAGNGVDADKRRPGTEWNHSVQDMALMVRDYVKWDDYPMSLQHFAESAVRAYKIAMTPPSEPVLIGVDTDLQEEPIHAEGLTIPARSPSAPPQGGRAALAQAARLLANAAAPVIIADRAARDQEGVNRLVELAEALGAAVIDLGSRMNFPSMHPLCQSGNRRAAVRDADVVLLLEVADPWAQFNSLSDPHRQKRRIAKDGVKIINLSMQDVYIRSNYQDFQRYQPADLAINGDAQASLPALIEEVKRALSEGQRRAAAERAAKLAGEHRKSLDRTRENAAVGWDASPVSTARLAMEVWSAVKNEPWSLAVSDRITWAQLLWPTTQYHHMLGGAGAISPKGCSPSPSSPTVT